MKDCGKTEEIKRLLIPWPKMTEEGVHIGQKNLKYTHYTYMHFQFVQNLVKIILTFHCTKNPHNQNRKPLELLAVKNIFSYS
jgi:hypothetical protein